MKYTYNRLREIYRRIGGEDSGKIYSEFFRAIDNNEMSETQALLMLATELAERDLNAHELNMKYAEDMDWDEENKLTDSQNKLIAMLQSGAALLAPKSGNNEDVNFLIKEGYIKNFGGFLTLTKKGRDL